MAASRVDGLNEWPSTPGSATRRSHPIPRVRAKPPRGSLGRRALAGSGDEWLARPPRDHDLAPRRLHSTPGRAALARTHVPDPLPFRRRDQQRPSNPPILSMCCGRPHGFLHSLASALTRQSIRHNRLTGNVPERERASNPPITFKLQKNIEFDIKPLELRVSRVILITALWVMEKDVWGNRIIRR